MNALVLTAAIGAFCPDVALECLDPGYEECLDPWTQLEAAGALSWEIEALRAISRDGRSKGRFDVVATDCGSAGLIHRRPRARFDGMGFGLRARSDCPYRDRRWRDRVRARLYHDWAQHDGAATLAAWRGVVAGTLEHAWSERGDTEVLFVTASLANSSPSEARSIGAQARWRPDRMVDRYVANNPTLHRQRRAEAIRALQ